MLMYIDTEGKFSTQVSCKPGSCLTAVSGV
jgi:hypothetical protein